MRDFEKFYEECKAYLEEFGDLYVPAIYQRNGYKLGEKVHNVRRGLIRTDENEKTLLNGLNFVWRVVSYYPFAQIYLGLCVYKAKNGHLNMSAGYVTSSGFPLGRMARNIRIGHRKVSDTERQMLLEIGFEFRNASKKSSRKPKTKRKVTKADAKPNNMKLSCEATRIEEALKIMDNKLDEALEEGYYPLESVKISQKNGFIQASQTVVLLE